MREYLPNPNLPSFEKIGHNYPWRAVQIVCNSLHNMLGMSFCESDISYPPYYLVTWVWYKKMILHDTHIPFTLIVLEISPYILRTFANLWLKQRCLKKYFILWDFFLIPWNFCLILWNFCLIRWDFCLILWDVFRQAWDYEKYVN